MKLLSIMVIAGSLLFGQAAFALADCGKVSNSGNAMRPNLKSVLTTSSTTYVPPKDDKQNKGQP